jgi:hypothetical protein
MGSALDPLLEPADADLQAHAHAVATPLDEHFAIEAGREDINTYLSDVEGRDDMDGRAAELSAKRESPDTPAQTHTHHETHQTHRPCALPERSGQ